MEANTAVLAGRLTSDPEVRHGANSGKPYAKFSIAVRRSGKQDAESDFFDCTAFGKSAVRPGNYGRKGALVLVAGRLQQDKWEKDGQKRSKVVVIADSVRLGQLPEGSEQDIGRADVSGYGEPAPKYQGNDREPSNASRQQGVQVEPDEMPF